LKYIIPEENTALAGLLDEAGKLTFSLARSLSRKPKPSL
jgi:hypothetical protein